MRDELTIHHLFWPSRWYRSQIERDFRELCCHKVMLTRSAHNLVHRYQAEPGMPTRGDQLHAIIVHTRCCVPCYNKLKRRHYLIPNHRKEI